MTLQPAFRALADPTRREILTMLAAQDMTVAQVAGQFDMTRAAVKKHLVILEEGALIRSEPKGRERINRLAPDGLRPAFEWLGFFDRFWDDRLAALAQAITDDSTGDPS